MTVKEFRRHLDVSSEMGRKVLEMCGIPSELVLRNKQLIMSSF